MSKFNSIKNLFKEPLIQFLLIGAAIYGMFLFMGEPTEEEQDRQIVITEDHVNSLAIGFGKRWNRPPTNEELLGLVREYISETLLYREALSMGLDKDDHVIRRRMAQKLKFLTNDLVTLVEPEEEILEQYLQENMDSFRASDLISFTHVFINPEQRGDDAMADAETLLAQLQVAGPPSQETLAVGDRFMMQNYFPDASHHEVQRQLGEAFADSVMKLEPGAWHGPVSSGYGIHLVYVSDFVAAEDPLLADVRQKVLDEYFRQQTEKFNAEYLEALSERYEIIMDESLDESQPGEPVAGDGSA